MTVPPRQHLLIQCRPDMRISIDDYALIVIRGRAVPQRFPLTRLRQVTLVGDTALPSQVLLRLGNAGIRIHLQSTDAHTQAIVLGTQTAAPDIEGDLEAFLNQSDWRRTYIQWRIRQDFWGALHALGGHSHVQLGLRDIRPASVARRLYRHHPTPMQRLATIAPALRAEALACLHARGWPLETLRLPYPGINALRDVARALHWEAITIADDAPELPLTTWLARHQSLLQQRGHITIDNLRRLLRQAPPVIAEAFE